MSWRDKLVPASYDGVQFQVSSVEKTYTNEHAKHRFVHQDGAYFEPLQADSNGFKVEAFVLGADYMEQRDALVEALKTSPGIYQDPLTGNRRYVAVLSYSVSEGVDEGMGFARISIEMEESLQDPFAPPVFQAPPQTKTTPRKYLQWADGISKSGYKDALETAQEYIEGVADTVTQLSDEVDNLRAAIYGPLSGTLLALQETASALNTLENSIESLARAPEAMWDQLTTVFGTLSNLDFLDSFTRLHPPVDPTTYTDPGQQAGNDAQVAVNKAFQQVALMSQGSALVAEDWTSADEALAARDRWAALMLAQEGDLTETSYEAWVNARVTVSAYLEILAARLPHLMVVDCDQPTSTLELAHRYYVDAKRATEITDRNVSILHPGFVTGDITILAPGV